MTGMTPRTLLLLWGACASLGEVHPHHQQPRAQQRAAELDLAPLADMRGGLVKLRNKLAGELAGLHHMQLPAVPEEQIDAHFDGLTERLLAMEGKLAEEPLKLHDPQDKAQAFQLRSLAAQTRDVLKGVNGKSQAAALAKAKRALVELKQTLDSLPRPHAAPRAAPHPHAAPHSLVEQTASASHLDQKLAQAHAKEAKYDEALGAASDLDRAIQAQVDGLKASQAAETKKAKTELEDVLVESGLVKPTPLPALPKAPKHITDVLPEASAPAMPAMPDLYSATIGADGLETQLRGTD